MINTLSSNMTAGSGVSPMSGGDPHHPPGMPRGFRLGGGGYKLGQSAPFSGMKFSDLNDRNLYNSMKAIDPNNPGAMPPYNPEAARQRQNAYNKMKQMYDQRRDTGLRQLAREQYPAQNPEAPPLDQETPHSDDSLWKWSELDDYNLMHKDEEFIGYPNAPDKVAFPGNFSHPEGAVAYFTGGFQPSPANREIVFPDGTQVFPPTDYQSDVVGNISFDHFDDGTEGGGWMIGGPADNPAASLWVQGNSGPAALQQNANIANQHYNYIYTDNEWGY